MRVDRLSVTLEADLGEAVRAAAGRSGLSVSSWMSSAAADRLRNDLLGSALDDWEAEDGAFTAEELAAAAGVLSRSGRSDGAADVR